MSSVTATIHDGSEGVTVDAFTGACELFARLHGWKRLPPNWPGNRFIELLAEAESIWKALPGDEHARPPADDLFDGYFCVFAGRPELCTPLAMFVSEGYAAMFNTDIGDLYPVITLDDWRQSYNPDNPDENTPEETRQETEAGVPNQKPAE